MVTDINLNNINLSVKQQKLPKLINQKYFIFSNRFSHRDPRLFSPSLTFFNCWSHGSFERFLARQKMANIRNEASEKRRMRVESEARSENILRRDILHRGGNFQSATRFFQRKEAGSGLFNVESSGDRFSLHSPLSSLSFSFFLTRKISWIVSRWNCASSMNHRFHRADIERERAYVYVCMSAKCWNVLEIYSGKIKCPELCVFLDGKEE